MINAYTYINAVLDVSTYFIMSIFDNGDNVYLDIH